MGNLYRGATILGTQQISGPKYKALILQKCVVLNLKCAVINVICAVLDYSNCYKKNSHILYCIEWQNPKIMHFFIKHETFYTNSTPGGIYFLI